MKKTGALAIVVFVIVSMLALGCTKSIEGAPPGLSEVSEFEGGSLYQSDKVFVCRLNGSYREMGRQYGGLMKAQIKQFHDEALKAIESNSRPTEEALREIPSKQYEKYPARIKNVFVGMAETSGLDIEDLKFCDSVATVAMSGELSRANCSAVAAWGPYTGGGPLVFGRNFDYPDYFKEFNDTLTVVVFNPDDGSRSTATLVNAGQVCTLNAFNDAGLMLEINDGMGSGDLATVPDRASSLIEALTSLMDASDFGFLNAELVSMLPYHAFIITASDSKEAFTYESSTSEIKKRGGREGLLVATNHFVNPEWGIRETPQPAWFEHFLADSRLRSDNLTALAEANKGKIDADTMKRIMDTPLDEGGATYSGTIYQFVAEPSERALWVQAPGFQDWTLVEYGKLFD